MLPYHIAAGPIEKLQFLLRPLGLGVGDLRGATLGVYHIEMMV
jgi:hypothetical protein